MRHALLRTLLPLALASSALAQGDVDYVLNVPIEDLGTLHLASGVITPPIAPQGVGALATPGEIYNNTCLPYGAAPCGIVFTNGVTLGQTRIDDGRLPSRTSPAPAAGVMDSYRVTSFQIGYCTTEDDPSIGGPGARIAILFWENYDGCINMSTAGAPTRTINLALPGTLTTGTNRCITVAINLVGGFEFSLKADADGSYQGMAADDKFGWGFQPTAITAGKTVSIIRAGAPAGTNACLVGDGTFYQNPGATVPGTGLDNDNTYWLQSAATTGNCFAGAATQANCAAQPGAVYGGYYLRLTADLDDCNANGRPDFDDIAGLFSNDLNANGIPDECDPPPAPVSFCTAGTSTNGCNATITSTGVARASASSGFTLNVANVEGQKQGLIFYSVTGQQAAPWGTGTSFLCVKAPTQRLPSQASGGSLGACDGSFSADWLAFMASTPNAIGNPLAAGRTFQAQAWYRDPPAPKTTNLSDGLEFILAP
jgi:hypothetical protein